MLLIRIVFFLLLKTFVSACPSNFLVDFNQALSRYGIDSYHYQISFTPLLQKNNQKLASFKEIYESALFAPPKMVSTPKIIHQIWLGGPIPEKYMKWMKTWSTLSGWQYKLWTDKEATSYPLVNREAFEKANNYGEKSDIFRYEILYNEGGVYVDTDCMCINPAFFEYAHDHFDFYIAFEPLNHRCLGLGNAVMGSIPKHPLVKQLIDNLKKNIDTLTKENKSTQNIIEISISKTGPLYIDSQVEIYLKQPHKTVDVFLPPTFFFPVSGLDCVRTQTQLKRFISPETASIHAWEGSWLPWTGIPKIAIP